MTNNIAIEVTNLSIKYKCIKPLSIKNSFFSFKKSKSVEVEALKNISFSVPKGEILGIIGKNGSGKSTLLRAIAGIFSPDAGQILLSSNHISLLSIGVGFQKNLSGRQNIILSGMLLGFKEPFIRSKMEEIIKFSELGTFIDMPVKSYSSGMFSKLAFSITAILETEIMLIDEVLSVGDAKFKKKSYKKIESLISNQDRTVLIVSHSIESLRKLCTSILWIDEGKVKMYGTTDEVLSSYEKFMEN